MEEEQEKIVANEIAETSKFLTRDCNMHMNHIEPEACRSVMSISSGWPESSTLINLDAVNGYCTNRGALNSTPNLTSTHPLNGVGFVNEETVARNYAYWNSRVAGCSSTKEENNERGRWLHQLEYEGQNNKRKIPGEVTMSMDLGSLDSSLRGDFKRVRSTFQSLSSNQSNVDHVAGCPNNIIFSDRPFGGSPYKALFSSSTEAFHPMLNMNSLNSQLQPHDMDWEEPEMPHSGINLREWLVSKGVIANKNEKLCLFKKIVKIVDFAHSKRIALMDLRPSSFIMLETGDVEYIGSLMETMNPDTTKNRGSEVKISARGKMQKVGRNDMVRPEKRSISRSVKDKATNQFSHGNFDVKNSCLSMWDAQSSIYEGTSSGKSWLTYDNAQLEKRWYDFPDEFITRDLLSSNIYALGLLLFEFLCHFGSIKAHSAAMLDLRQRILPPCFLCENPKEAGFCFWLLHPEPSSRPTTREILQSELICESVYTNTRKDETSCTEMVGDGELNLLLNFLVTLEQHKKNKVSKLLESVDLLDKDIKVLENRQACRKYLDVSSGEGSSNMKDYSGVEDPCPTSRMNEFRDKLLGNINELENVYFSLRSTNVQLSETPVMDRSDKDVLRKRGSLSSVQAQYKNPTTEEKQADRVGIFFDGICNFARYNKFEVCGTLRNDTILNSDNVISSLSFDRDGDFIAAAGVSKKIKFFELASLLDDVVDAQYPVLELSNESKFSCICWNNYIRSYLASTDYDGLVQIWDANIGQGIAQYNEHRKRAWSVDFSRVDPMKFASGGDDCSLRIWSINEKNSTCTISNPANICCVQFSPYSSHLLAFGSADYKIYCYDLRHTRIPWCTLAGHDNTVSYVRFLDSETLVSASTDNTLKTWDLNKTSLEGLSSNACSLTLSGHTNKKNFVGLAVLDGYIACGSETNEVYAYHKSLPMPITSHKFEYIDPISGHEISDGDEQFVSSVCWRRNLQVLAAANSSGSIKILRIA